SRSPPVRRLRGPRNRRSDSLCGRCNRARPRSSRGDYAKSSTEAKQPEKRGRERESGRGRERESERLNHLSVPPSLRLSVSPSLRLSVSLSPCLSVSRSPALPLSPFPTLQQRSPDCWECYSGKKRACVGPK